MSKELINAAKLIKEECNKHNECEKCFYGYINEEGLIDCIVEGYRNCPSIWDLSKLEENND